MIEAACCDAEEQPDLCYKVGGKAPKMIPCKCSHALPTEWGNCGIDYLLKIKECKGVAECEKVVPVMEWRQAPRAGFKKMVNQIRNWN
jgi:hypothetical protein